MKPGAPALSHARSRSAAVLSGHVGKGDAFDEAVAPFFVRYADQNERSHTALTKAIRAGKVEARFEEDR